jgi:Arc-like DNA binding dprotein
MAIQINLRVDDSLRAKLASAAERRGVSMNREINDRLERSLDQDAAFENAALLAILRVVAASMHETGQHAGFYATAKLEAAQNWLDNAYAYDQAVRSATKLLEAMRPDGDASPPKRIPAMVVGDKIPDFGDTFAQLGDGLANTIIEEIAMGRSRSSDNEARPARLREGLGERILERIKKFHERTWSTQASTRKGKKQ